MVKEERSRAGLTLATRHCDTRSDDLFLLFNFGNAIHHFAVKRY